MKMKIFQNLREKILSQGSERFPMFKFVILLSDEAIGGECRQVA